MNRKKRTLGQEPQRKNVDPETNKVYVQKLSDMVNCRTVFTPEGTYQVEFDRFYQVIEKHFPLLSRKAERLTFGSGCFVYILRGRDAVKNIMLMSHHDVVDGSDQWKTDPFRAEVQGDFLYGRGTIDTKTPLFAELQAAEELLAESYAIFRASTYTSARPITKKPAGTAWSSRRNTSGKRESGSIRFSTRAARL